MNGRRKGLLRMHGRVILLVGLICLATNGVSAFSSGIFTAAPTMRNKAAISPFALRMQSSGDSDSASAKASMLSAAAAAPPNGVDASPEQRADMDAKLKALCELNPTKEPAYALLRPPFQFFDGTYQLVYTDTKGGSSGKVGPFVGRVTQTFEGIRDLDQMGFSRRGIFLNAVEIGPLKVSLRARCESKSETKLEVVFEETETFILGQRVARKEFAKGSKGSKGSWDIKYLDDDTRILKTNAGNWITMTKTEPSGGESYMERQKRMGDAP